MNNIKIFKGTLGRKLFYRRSCKGQQAQKRHFEWANSVKPGDLINCCDYWNRKVISFEHIWGTLVVEHNQIIVDKYTKDRNAFPDLFWVETVFYFDDGTQHSTNGGCAVQPLSFEEVKKFHPSCDENGCKPCV
jgi:hypothetical protein